MVASKEGAEQAGSRDFQQSHFNKMFAEGFSFSGFERDGVYLSQRGKKFVEISGVSGLDSISDGRGAVFADFDNDGDTDIFLTTVQGDGHLLFRNNIGSRKGFLRVTLAGTKSGTDAFGAVVRVKTSAGTLTKVKAGGSGFLSQHDPRLLFGLGNDAGAEWIEIAWPSGLRQRLGPVRARSSIRVTEGRDGFETISEKRFSLPEPLSSDERLLSGIKPRAGAKLPSLALAELGGGAADLARVVKPGRITLVNLWATWCSVCPAEMKELERLRREQAGLDVVGLSLDAGEPAKLRDFLTRHAVTYPVYMLPETALGEIYSSEEIAVPLSLLIGKDGRVEAVFSGWNARTREDLLRRLAR